MSMIHLTLSPQYVSTWGTWEGIREIIQNAIDKKDYDITFKEDGSLSVVSRGGVLEKETLLLGTTTKRDDENSIGNYGEGFKLAMLVLLREGKTISIKNGYDRWVPVFDDHPQLNKKCLAVEIIKNEFEDRPQEVEFIIEGLTQDEIFLIQENVLQKDAIERADGSFKGSFYWKEKQSRYEFDEYEDDEDREREYETANRKKARLFVGGLFVCELDDKFSLSYNFAPNILHLDRDRQSVNTFNLSIEATKVIALSGNSKLLAKLAQQKAADVSDYVSVTGGHGYYNASVEPEVSKEIVRLSSDLFVKEHGEKSYPINNEWDEKKKRVQTQKAIKSGYVPVTVTTAFYKMLDKKLTDKKVEDFQEFNLSSAIRQYFEENKNQLRGKPRKNLEKIIEQMNLYEGFTPLSEDTRKKVVVDKSIPLGEDIPF